jgi:endogenous inhibitor of DNA gyrase (YacG/DUF329 family)
MTDEPATATQPAAKPCPICGKPAVPASKPFCSPRCADVDLNRWLGGVYAIPSVPSDDEEPPDEGDVRPEAPRRPPTR